jgi:L-seryl-tRNA(Ser) seleniumtransferase
MTDQQNLFRKIPAVDQLLLRPAIIAFIEQTSREFVVSEIQKLLQGIRDRILSGDIAGQEFSPENIETALSANLQKRLTPSLRSVINATGVILHTNLGRAPLSLAAQKSLSSFSVNYANLEYDIQSGQRSHRDKLIESLLKEVVGCEAATVVNNNSAAVFLILNSLACGKEVIVSRSELVEIGGSFRIPDIMARSGALLREVGTTNKTRIEDYRNAITPNTGLLLRVHPSNFRMLGFTEKPELKALAELSKASNVPLVEDIGSGCLISLKAYGITDEPIAQESLAAGANLICFSGDKIFGGPQAGIIAGAKKLVEPIRKNPLMRTYRVEKLIYGALEATLGSYRFGKAEQEIPVLRMISMTKEEVSLRARRFSRTLKARLSGKAEIRLVEGNSVVGGGSCPECSLPTLLISVESSQTRPNVIESRMRLQNPAIILRLEEDRALIDLRTVFPHQEKMLIDGIVAALQ